MADRGLALLDASNMLLVIEEKGELRVAGASGGPVRLRIAPVQGSALGSLYEQGESVAIDKPRGQEAAFLHELGLEARSVMVEPFSWRGRAAASRSRCAATATSASPTARRSKRLRRASPCVSPPSARSRSNACATGWRRASASGRAGRARSTTSRIQGIGALRMRLANARNLDDKEALAAAVEEALEGLGIEIDGLRHLITELRPAALDDLGLAAALEALARRAQAIDGLDVTTEIEFGRDEDLHPGEAHNGGGRARPRARVHHLQGRPGGAHECQPTRRGDTRGDPPDRR